MLLFGCGGKKGGKEEVGGKGNGLFDWGREGVGLDILRSVCTVGR